ncbi:MAG: hypothetical protein ACP5P4_09770 [Steroidobacteraceae bacterium]
MLLIDEVVFRHRGADGQDAQAQVPLAVGLLLAANALRAGEVFALGYPGDPVGGIARVVGGRLFVHRDVAGTLSGMQAFLDRYAEALIEQSAAGPGQSGPGGGKSDEPVPGTSGPLDPPDAGVDFSPTAA